jgi:hypothetical protein
VITGVRAAVGVVLAAAALLGFAVSLGLAGAAESQTGTTTTSTAPPTTPPPTQPPTEPPVEPPPAPGPAPIAFGVTVGGVSVGGMHTGEATEAVRRAYRRPIPLVVNPERTIRLAPSTLRARPDIQKAVRRARFARPGLALPLDVDVRIGRIRDYVRRLGNTLDRTPLDARVALVGVRPRAFPAREGRLLERRSTSRAILLALKRNERTPLELPFDVRKPDVTSVEYDGAIVILRSSNRLLLYGKKKLVQTFGVATGQASFPTPLGAYEIVTMQRDPWWYPPPSDWAADSEPVPPGPGNPLGTRWMGISAPYVGIHGTPDAASIGYSASHGCVRMRITDAEWLFNRVKVGTPVFIVPR